MNKKSCPRCKKEFNPNKAIRIYDEINRKWINMTSGDWATGTCSRYCHYMTNKDSGYDADLEPF
jgi:hypothetical protein